MTTLKSKILKFMANNKDWDLVDGEGNFTSTATRTAKALHLYQAEAKKIMEMLVEDGLAKKRVGTKYCKGHTRYYLTDMGKEVAKL